MMRHSCVLLLASLTTLAVPACTGADGGTHSDEVEAAEGSNRTEPSARPTTAKDLAMGSSSAIAPGDSASPTESAAPSGSTAESAAAESATTTTGTDPDPSSGSSATSPTDPTSPQATTAGGTTADDDWSADQSEGAAGGAAGDANADDTNAADVTPNTEVDDGSDPGLQDSGMQDDDLPQAEPCVVDHGGQTPSLGEYYADYFALGTAIDAQYNQYSDTIVKHFNSLTAENEMKFDALQPTEGNFTFDTADQMIALARSNGMQVRGHALVWHNQTPSWVFSGSQEQVLTRMKTHIQTVMQHFRGEVHAWDVVNEAIMDDGSFRGENGGSGWYEALGESYIAEAFRAAREADPSAKLYYNDYANYHPPRREGIYDMLAGLIADGVPIDGVGLQAHMHLAPGPNHDVIRHQTVEEMETAILLYASLGLDIQITEVDVSMYVLGEEYTPDTYYTLEKLTPELLEQQADRYREFFELFRKHSDVISSVTMWGIADNNTWLSEFPSGQEDFPLLFDAQQRPKPSFWALVDFCN